MKRSPLKRKTPLRRGGRINPRNEDGTGNIIPLCRSCHTAQHSHGWGHVFRYGKPHAKSIAIQVGKDFRLLQFSEKSGNESGAPW